VWPEDAGHGRTGEAERSVDAQRAQGTLAEVRCDHQLGYKLNLSMELIVVKADVETVHRGSLPPSEHLDRWFAGLPGNKLPGHPWTSEQQYAQQPSRLRGQCPKVIPSSYSVPPSSTLRASPIVRAVRASTKDHGADSGTCLTSRIDTNVSRWGALATAPKRRYTAGSHASKDAIQPRRTTDKEEVSGSSPLRPTHPISPAVLPTGLRFTTAEWSPDGCV
jgi:hypothetical protein